MVKNLFLSNRDIQWAISCGKLIVDPSPDIFGDKGYDSTALDLHLGPIKTAARIWDINKFIESRKSSGHDQSVIRLGDFDWDKLSTDYLIEIPEKDSTRSDQLVFCEDKKVIVKPQGFLLWTTKEKVGTPDFEDENKRVSDLISFVNAKSTRARTGIMVHFTAPTINAAWQGNITLEIINLGPFWFEMKEDDVIAQLTVATISSPPDQSLIKKKSVTNQQISPAGKKR